MFVFVLGLFFVVAAAMLSAEIHRARKSHHDRVFFSVWYVRQLTFQFVHANENAGAFFPVTFVSTRTEFEGGFPDKLGAFISHSTQNPHAQQQSWIRSTFRLPGRRAVAIRLDRCDGLGGGGGLRLNTHRNSANLRWECSRAYLICTL